MRERLTGVLLWALAGSGLAACGTGADEPAGSTVVTSGKVETPLEDVPAEVLQAVRAARPELAPESAAYEIRDGREYYDIEGRLPDDAEVELDLTLSDHGWKVVEVQRDVTLDQVEAAVRRELAAARPDWSPTRVIESDQGQGLVIYEFFGPGPAGEETKTEVKWEDGSAEVLQAEWMH